MRYFLKRLLHAIFLLLGVSILSFVFTSLAPGNYFDEMRLNPQISPDTVTALRAHYGVDRPVVVRYARWLASVLGAPTFGWLSFQTLWDNIIASDPDLVD